MRASTASVAIKDDGFLDRNAWVLSPETRPDVYTAFRSRKPKQVVFYTDLDSLSVPLEPGGRFNFIILLNGKDSCFTQIVSSVPAPEKLSQMDDQPDTIPFELTDKQAILVSAIVNESDTLPFHFDLGSLQFRITRDGLSKTSLWPTGSGENAAKTRAALSKVEQIRMGKTTWINPAISLANMVATGTSGRFGWQVFDNRIFEIDYDRSQIILYRSLPKKASEYSVSEIHFLQSLFCLEATVKINNHSYSGNFLVDTGSDLAMILDSSWMSRNCFPTNMPLLKKIRFTDGSGQPYESKIVSIPTVELHHTEIANIPTSLLGAKSPVGAELNYFGNDLLKRFNMLVDLKTDRIYLKPNRLARVPFQKP